MVRFRVVDPRDRFGENIFWFERKATSCSRLVFVLPTISRSRKPLAPPRTRWALISLLNAILTLPVPIVDVTIENPFNLQDFHDDKLSILDIRAVDQRGAIYDVEMQLSAHSGLVKRIVFYGCEVYAGQLKAGDDYSELKPVYSICLLLGQLWDDSPKVHHAFRLVDRDSGRLLHETLEIHTLELGWYNLKESDLETASLLDRWLYWLLHAPVRCTDPCEVVPPARVPEGDRFDRPDCKEIRGQNHVRHTRKSHPRPAMDLERRSPRRT